MFSFFKKKRTVPSYDAVRFDGASRDSELENHWRFTDGQSINASLSPDVRKRLRERCRYEIANNAVAARAARLIVGDVVGTGVRLQLSVSPFVETLNDDQKKEVEWAFCEWCDAVNLTEKLSAMRFARFQDGEAFAIFYNNKNLETTSGVKLDLFLVDAERVCSELFIANENEVDGVELDKYGVPTRYRILDRHPGDNYGFTFDDATYYDASNVIHWFDRQLPEQRRGIPELTPCLNVMARLARYQKAVLGAAETAANLALMLYTDLSAADIDALTPEDKNIFPDHPGASFAIGSGTSWALPAGFKPAQLKSEQPTSTYGDFNDRLLALVGGAINIPKFLITNSADGTTYAGGRLELQSYVRYVRRDQKNCETNVLNKIFAAWFKEFALINNIESKTPPHVWYFDGFEHIDPLKEANAQVALLNAGATNLASIYGKQGLDWEDQAEQRAIELKKIKELETKYEIKFNSTPESNSNQNGEEGSEESEEGNDESGNDAGNDNDRERVD